MMVASALMGTLEAVFLRLLGDQGSQAQVLLFRSGMQLALVAGVGAAMTGGVAAMLKTRRLRKHLLRGSLAAVSCCVIT